jgi:hypothetical protein
MDGPITQLSNKEQNIFLKKALEEVHAGSTCQRWGSVYLSIYLGHRGRTCQRRGSSPVRPSAADSTMPPSSAVRVACAQRPSAASVGS